MNYEALKYITQATGYRKHKPCKSGMPVILKRNIPANKIDATVPKSNENDAPMLYLFLNENVFDIAIVTADEKLFHLQAGSLGMAIFIFIGIFFVFEIGYNPRYSQFLGFMQKIFLNVPYEDKKSQGFVLTLNDFEETLKDVIESKVYKPFV